MATRARQSTARPTPSREGTIEPTQRRGGNELPPYEKPSFPLNPAAQRALEQLTRTHNLKKLEDSLSEASKALALTAGEINDCVFRKEQAARERKKRNEQASTAAETESEEDLEQKLEEMKNKVEAMTNRMDASIRQMIDGQHSVQSMKQSIAGSYAGARTTAATQATQRTQQLEDFTPTDPGAATQNQPAPMESFKSKLEDAKTRYQFSSMTQRYAENPTYLDFRRVVHDARYPSGDVELPHQSEWFEDGTVAAPGMTKRTRGNDEDEDDDEDIAISRANISIKCPLTLQDFKYPLSSKKCPHSFEKDAINDLIRRSGGRGVQCPVPGCSQMLTKDDLHTDAVVVRQIKRLKRARELEEEEAEEGADGGENEPTVIDDEDGDADDVDDIIEGRATQVKSEPRASNARASIEDSTNMDVDEDDNDGEQNQDEDENEDEDATDDEESMQE